jgi:hypothetical protein
VNQVLQAAVAITCRQRHQSPAGSSSNHLQAAAPITCRQRHQSPAGSGTNHLQAAAPITCNISFSHLKLRLITAKTDLERQQIKNQFITCLLLESKVFVSGGRTTFLLTSRRSDERTEN